ncbi:hypothetical protein [Actinoallomurus rhizosphaericola]|uniref:hypothetical protein n=1 Tax=Actinoallomurus rhizosphaericola TaxID=2952536 RepID=UPI0020923877|nr:hypothetical protein [Actinoallomurus rhizosphaericola]MCO5998464.1 hypothetical protein [Actinoallomurus rhizosphaericola]
MNRGLLLAGTAGLVLVLVCLTWSTRRPARPAHPAHGPDRASRAPAAGATAVRPIRTAADAGRLLPFAPDQLARAAQLAQTFAAAYSTHRYNEPPAEYLQRLTPMMSPSLRAVIERAANDPAVAVQRQRTQEVCVGEARTEAIRELGPASITFVVTATEYVTTAYTARQDTARYAITLIPITGDGWKVYDIELAAAGQAGDSGGIP